METKYYLIFLALLLSFGFTEKMLAQKCLVFAYDADGNRVSRTVTTNCQEKREIAEEQDKPASEEEMAVYPNPNNGSFKVLVPSDIKKGNASFELYNIEGQLVIEGILHKPETDIDIGNKPAGVYLLRIINGDDAISKIVLKH